MRVHLFELEDQAWFPRVLRDAGTAYLRKMAELSGQPAYMAPVLGGLLRETGQDRLIDLCSGGAGPLPQVVDALRAEGLETTALLTDLHPNQAAFAAVAGEGNEGVNYSAEPVDAMRVPASLRGVRTLFNGFHHFRPEHAQAILQDAVDAGQPIAVFEAVERSPAFLLGIHFSPIPVLLLVPFLRPFDWRWLVFTYVIPLIPLFVLWDGFVSGLRVYTERELRDMTDSMQAPGWSWEVGRIRMGKQPVSLSFLTGRPALRGSDCTRSGDARIDASIR